MKKISFDKIFERSLKDPSFFVNREEFLRKEFKNYSPETVNKAIASTPVKAGIKREEIDTIADAVISKDSKIIITVYLTMTEKMPYMLRTAQKLMYLYGFPQISFDEGEGVDTRTKNQLILCLGVMYGVAGANSAVKRMANALAEGVEKELFNTAFTESAIYLTVKNIAKWFDVKFIINPFISTFFSFESCYYRLKNVLKDTMLSNPEHIPDKEENTPNQSNV